MAGRPVSTGTPVVIDVTCRPERLAPAGSHSISGQRMWLGCQPHASHILATCCGQAADACLFGLSGSGLLVVGDRASGALLWQVCCNADV